MSIINKSHNIVVFDLDETIGNFTELSIFWEALNKYSSDTLSHEDFSSYLTHFQNF
jgi:phosphoglycolate phosphatase-like HAD superfamily hydrolase